ncbi:TorD/DmsD family molecular chaperone [Meridianimarinicoccus aquatilis]|uniref:Molecular chaperone TorD n=1 Tax=Meridianimarinicoccus aquatilis TaxID=2552766 RepID=A0A4R6B2U1_9RHOB|nr:molecular chaperone TorD family protein [Fluviibacterium aquatile]TDL90582.1 molecular chaperone TorD [Fluviibacterium aquatile]
MSADTLIAIADEDRLRADLYGFLSALLAGPPDRTLLEQTAALQGGDDDMGTAIAGLANVARVTTAKGADREFTKLFIGLGRGELLPYASYYLTGFLNEKPLASLRRDMAAQGITRAPNVFEPEDNIASLLEMMGGMILGNFGEPATLDTQRTFWNRHIGPWAGHFFSDLESAKNSVLYGSVGAIGKLFMDIEREAFRLGTPD